MIVRRGSDEGGDASYHSVTMVTARAARSEALSAYNCWGATPPAYCLELPQGEGGVSASAWSVRADDRRRCSSHLVPTGVTLSSSPSAEHGCSCKLASLSTGFILTPATVRHILGTVALGALASFWKYLLKTAAGRVALGSIDSESVAD